MAPADKKTLKDFCRNPVAIILGSILLFFASQIMSAMLSAPFVKYLPSQNYQIVLFIGLNVAVLYVLLSLILQLGGFSWRSIGWRKPQLKTVLYVIPAVLIYFVISTVFTMLATKFIPGFNVKEVQDVGFANLQNHPWQLIAAFVSLVILTPIFEETIFRGVLFRGLRFHMPFWLSAIIVSGVFAVAHLQWNVAVDVFALSLILCWLTEKSDSIIPGMLLHGIKNSLAFILLFVIK